MKTINTSFGVLNSSDAIAGCMEYLSKEGLGVKNKKGADFAVDQMVNCGLHIPFGIYSKSWTKSDAAIMKSAKKYDASGKHHNALTYINIFCVLYIKKFLWERVREKLQVTSRYGSFNNTVYYVSDRFVRETECQLIGICREAYFDTILGYRPPEHYLNLYHLGFYKKKIFSHHAIPFFYYCKQKSKLDYKVVNH